MLETPEAANPYAAPQVPVADVLPEGTARPLASRWARLGGAVVDGVLGLICTIPVMVVFFPQMMQSPGTTPGLEVTLWLYAALTPLLVTNGYFLWKDGQTLGKKAAGTRIVRVSGDRVSFSRIFLLRLVVPGLIGAVPFLGIFFSLTNVLFIFGPARRCLHDYMADTIVVQAG